MRLLRGFDELNKTLFFTACFCLLFGLALNSVKALTVLVLILRILGAVFMMLLLLRQFGGNSSKRAQENLVYLRTLTAIRDFFKGIGRKIASFFQKKDQKKDASKEKRKKEPNPFRRAYDESKAYRILICPQCSQRLRVPRGKGRIRVTCTRCGNRFDAKS